MTEKPSNWNLFWDKRTRDIDTYRQKKEIDEGFVPGYKQILAEEVLKREPQTDWSSVPGYKDIQTRYDEKVRQQGGSLYTAKKDEKGKTTGYSPKPGAKEKQDAETAANPIVMGKEGYEPASGQKRKDYVFGQIQKKRQMGMGISKAEGNFEKKYLGISDSKDAPTSGKDWDDTLKVAKDMVMADKVTERAAQMNQEGKEPYQIEGEIEMMKKAPVTFDEGVGSLAKALKFRYPNMDEERIAEITSKYAKDNEGRWIEDLGITLPPEIDNWQKAYQFMIDNGMDEATAEQWIRDRQPAEEE